MSAVSECDLQLDSVGEDGSDPADYKLNFVAGLHCHRLLCECPLFFSCMSW